MNIIHKGDPVGIASRQLAYLDDGKARYSYNTDIEWLIFSDQLKEFSLVSKIIKSPHCTTSTTKKVPDEINITNGVTMPLKTPHITLKLSKKSMSIICWLNFFR